MQVTAPSNLRIQEIIQILKDIYGPWRKSPAGDPLAELVGTILSQNTSDLNSGRAFEALRAAYSNWRSVLDAPVPELAETIKSGGLANIKAARIQATLHEIVARTGRLDLDFLADLPVDDARRWLSALPGVGGKTASCVLLFALGKPAMPVDTHVGRVSVRLGIAPPGSSPDAIAAVLESALPADSMYDGHLALINLGRHVCAARNPRCELCPVHWLCPRVGVEERKTA